MPTDIEAHVKEEQDRGQPVALREQVRAPARSRAGRGSYDGDPHGGVGPVDNPPSPGQATANTELRNANGPKLERAPPASRAGVSARSAEPVPVYGSGS